MEFLGGGSDRTASARTLSVWLQAWRDFSSTGLSRGTPPAIVDRAHRTNDTRTNVLKCPFMYAGVESVDDEDVGAIGIGRFNVATRKR